MDTFAALAQQGLDAEAGELRVLVTKPFHINAEDYGIIKSSVESFRVFHEEFALLRQKWDSVVCGAANRLRELDAAVSAEAERGSSAVSVDAPYQLPTAGLEMLTEMWNEIGVEVDFTPGDLSPSHDSHESTQTDSSLSTQQRQDAKLSVIRQVIQFLVKGRSVVQRTLDALMTFSVSETKGRADIAPCLTRCHGAQKKT
jgi:hypothetical protein